MSVNSTFSLADNFEMRDGEWYAKSIATGTLRPGAKALRVDPVTGELFLVVERDDPAEIGGYKTTTLAPNLHVDEQGKLFRVLDPDEIDSSHED